MSKKGHYQHIYDLCKEHMHAYVLAEMVDGTQMDGIITGLDDEYVYFAVPMGQESTGLYQRAHVPHMSDHDRQYWGGYPGYGYGYGYYPPRRFRRLVLPIAALAALSLLPWY